MIAYGPSFFVDSFNGGSSEIYTSKGRRKAAVLPDLVKFGVSDAFLSNSDTIQDIRDRRLALKGLSSFQDGFQHMCECTKREERTQKITDPVTATPIRSRD